MAGDSETKLNGVEKSNGLNLTQQYIDLVGVYQGVAIQAVSASIGLANSIAISNMKIAQTAFQAFTPKE